MFGSEVSQHANRIFWRGITTVIVVVQPHKLWVVSAPVIHTAFKAGIGRPEYMLFLRLRPDGRYEAVSGEVDPVLSIRELHSADGFFSDLGSK